MHTLAIGDGANDVSMIQTADVGIGKGPFKYYVNKEGGWVMPNAYFC